MPCPTRFSALLLVAAMSSLSCSAGSRQPVHRSTEPPGQTGAANAANAQPPRVAILELRLETLPPPRAAQLRAGVFRWLVGQAYRRVVAEETAVARLHELGLSPGCTVGPCLAQLGKQLGVERIVTGGVAAHGSSYDVLLTILETAGGTLLGQVSSRCDVCTFQELEAKVERAVAELHASLVARGKR